MTVTISDRRTTLDDAEGVTNWTGAGFGVVSSDVAEATNAVAASIGIGDQAMYYTRPTGTNDFSNTLVYVYSFNNALQNVWNNTIPPNGLVLGDGTNIVAFHMAGNDKRVFNHLDGPTNWQCLVLDGDQADEMDTAGNSYESAGTFASLSLSAITQVGAYHQTLSKALGGGYHIACDIIRHGNDGIYVQGGTTSGAAGTFSQLATADRSTVDGAGHGIFRELQPVAFGCQGPLTFADTTDTTNDQYFEDSGVTIVFEDRNISDGKYYFDVRGNSSKTQSFILRNSSIFAAGPSVKLATSADVNVMIFDAVQFVDWRGVLVFPTDSSSYTHEVENCTFNNCGKVSPGTIDFDDNTIIDSASTDTAIEITSDITALNMVISGYEGTADTSALIWNVNADPNGNLDGGSITKGTAATHAIEFGTSVPATMTLTDMVFSGYNSSDSQNDSTFYFADTGGAITLNLANCTGNATYKSAGATITIVSDSKVVDCHVQEEDADDIQNALVYLKCKRWALTSGTDITLNENGASADTITRTTGSFITDGFDDATFVNIKGSATGANDGRYTVISVVALTITLSIGDLTADDSSNANLEVYGTGPYPVKDIVTIVNSGTTATVTHTAHALIDNDYVFIDGASHYQNNGVFQINVTDVDTYTYTMLSAPGSSPTGTIESTFVPLWGLTDVSGDITDSRVFSGNQPVDGWVRKSTSSPLYKEFPLSGTILSASGLSLTAVMSLDE